MYSIIYIYIYVVHTHINVLLGKYIHIYIYIKMWQWLTCLRVDALIGRFGSILIALTWPSLGLGHPQWHQVASTCPYPIVDMANFFGASPQKLRPSISEKTNVEGARRRIDSSLFWFVPCGFCLETTYLHGLSVFPSHLPTLGVSRLLGQRNEGHPCSSWVNPLFFLMVTSH